MLKKISTVDSVERVARSSLSTMASRFGVVDSFDPEDNLQGGMRYLSSLLQTFGGDITLATAAYNAGEQAVLHLSRTRDGEVRQVGVVPTFDHVAFTCTDDPAMQSVLRTMAIQFTVDDAPERAQRQIFFRDPAGNGVELNFVLD